jgi:predicted nuclease of predicted toxin-antitoxin system
VILPNSGKFIYNDVVLKGTTLSVLKFYTDTHVDKQVAIQLRQQGIVVIRCEEVAMATASDEAHLTYAIELGHALITKDADFRNLHFQYMAEERQHTGIFFCADRYHAAIGRIVKTCAEYAQLLEEGIGTLEDIHNRLIEIR